MKKDYLIESQEDTPRKGRKKGFSFLPSGTHSPFLPWLIHWIFVYRSSNKMPWAGSLRGVSGAIFRSEFRRSSDVVNT